VFRELDRTTAWFRKYVRDPMRSDPDVLLATTVFRMFNRTEVGEAIFCQQDFARNNAFAIFCQTGETQPMRKLIRDFCGGGPYVTGAYIITSPTGYGKLDGVLHILKNFWKSSGWREASRQMVKDRMTLEGAWLWFKCQPYLGKFHSYEIVTDLRWTCVLEKASDKMSWCSVGPGARRGLNRVHERDKRDRSRSTEQMLDEMRFLLKCSEERTYWPTEWPRWEMRDVEHTLCEFDKYERVRLGEGRPRGVFA
jgi:hypothetical protein